MICSWCLGAAAAALTATYHTFYYTVWQREIRYDNMRESMRVCQFMSKCIKARVIPALKRVVVVLHSWIMNKRWVLCIFERGARVNSKSTTFEWRGMYSMFRSRDAVHVFVLCVRGESQNQDRYYWPVYLGAEQLGPALRFTTWNIKTRLLVILWSFCLLLLRPALEWSTLQTWGERKRETPWI